MNRITGGLVVAACAILLASCSNSEAGTPRADSEATPASEPDGTPTSEESGAPTSTGESPLDGIEPCDLLSPSEVSELGVAEGEDDDNLGDPGCSWTKSGDFGFSIFLKPEAGVGDANLDGYTVTPVAIGQHEAQQAMEEDVPGECTILVVISESSSVSIQATASGGKDTPKACGVGVQVAKIIDPKLP